MSMPLGLSIASHSGLPPAKVGTLAGAAEVAGFSADTDRHRGGRAPAERAGAPNRREGSDNQQDDAGDRVMNMRPSGRHTVPEWAAAVANHARDRPGQHERDDESQKAQHQRQLACREHVAVPP
jgi:hypothetical protein